MGNLGRSIMRMVTLLGMLSFAAVSTVQAAKLTFSFTDGGSDQTGTIDVTSMVMTFDDRNGAYTILLTADSAHPFIGEFRVNINLYNPDLDSLFQDVCEKCEQFKPQKNGKAKSKKGNDFNLHIPSTTLILTGVDSTLMDWAAGDRVVTSTFANLGNPPNASFFRSTVLNFPFGTFLSNEDCIACNTAGVATILLAP